MAFVVNTLAAYSVDLNFIGKLVALLSGLFASYAVLVIVFTVVIKLLLSPLDVWQKYSMKKQARILKRIQPQIDNLKKQCKDDQRLFMAKQQELFKKEGYSMMASCLPMIVTLVLIIVMFSGLTNYANYAQVENFNKLQTAYLQTLEQKQAEYDATHQKVERPQALPLLPTPTEEERAAYDAAMEKYTQYINDRNAAIVPAVEQAVIEQFEGTKESVLWVKNIFRPDTPWDRPVLTAENFKKLLTKEGQAAFNPDEYNAIMSPVFAFPENNTANGYLILPILSTVLSIFTTLLTTKMQAGAQPTTSTSGEAEAQQKMQQRIMMFIMPVMMGVFSLFYTAAVGLYFIINSVISLCITLVVNVIIERKFAKMDEQADTGYRRKF